MKKLLSILLVAAVAITGYTLWTRNQVHSSEEVSPVKGTIFSDLLIVKEMTVGTNPDAITYTIENKTGRTLEFGYAFIIKKLQADGTLVDTNLTEDMAFIMMLGSLEDGKSIEDGVSFDLLKEKPTDGTYFVYREYRDEQGETYVPRVSFEIAEGKVTILK